MDKKMTSGEIAKKTGISQKAVRLYDEKGLLKPSEYTEGNYRLYDAEALLVLEKIIALKQIGFSLEEIHDNLIAENNMNIKESLEQQLKTMEAKKQEIARTITCIKTVLGRSDGEPDWNSVAEIARMIQTDQKADDHHFKALKHTADNTDWYIKIYNSLGLKGNSRVLDLGCGFAKLWRNNWTDIPAGVVVDGYDLHGSWADNFAEYIEAHKSELVEGTQVSIHWSDVEEEETWKQLASEKPYTYVIAHYLTGFLKDKELFVERVATVLAEGGMFSCNDHDVSSEHMFWKQAFDAMKLNSAFISEKLKEKQTKHEDFERLLKKFFGKVENIKIPNNMRYENSDELFERLCEHYSESKKYLADNKNKIKRYFDDKLTSEGEVIVTADADFWHCYK